LVIVVWFYHSWGWAIIPLFPFLDLSKGQLAGATTASIISAEVAFVASIALLGKEAWERIKAVFKRKK
jgi:hypothetical protein